MADYSDQVATMTAIVGDVGHGVLLSLLRREKGDVQRAHSVRTISLSVLGTARPTFAHGSTGRASPPHQHQL